MAEVDDALEQREVAGVIPGVCREAPVDLDHVDRELPQVRKRRVAGPEIVEGEDDSEILDRLERLGDPIVGREQRALRKLEREQLRRQPRRVEGPFDVAEEVVVVELAGRDGYGRLHWAGVPV